MITHSEYMQRHSTETDKTAVHREFFAQFVTPYVISLVKQKIGVEKIKRSKDKHFNDIPLAEWDAIWTRSESGRGMWIEPGSVVKALLKTAGEGNSASTGVCILKEAARQIQEMSRPATV